MASDPIIAKFYICRKRAELRSAPFEINFRQGNHDKISHVGDMKSKDGNWLKICEFLDRKSSSKYVFHLVPSGGRGSECSTK